MPESGVANPFPGLRPYQDYEASMFFGRKDPAAEIIEKLGSQRFIAVVGTSGSGKSSIVNCGVLPSLYAGFYVPRGARWRVVRTEPGGQPIRRLAERVSAALADRLGGESGNGQSANGQSANGPVRAGQVEALSEAVLRYGDDGLVSLVRQARLPRSDNVLIVVDQFEELFRYRDQHASPDEATDFVRLLLRAAEDKSQHIYIMLTMRSDFLGDCMLIPGLPEAINDGIFLVPSMNRGEREQAVRGPVRVAGASMDPPLVNRILDDIGEEMDQLPLLQHALMRTWQEWEEDARAASEITLQHYLATVRNGVADHAAAAGGPVPDGPAPTVIERALDYHAAAVYGSLTPDQQDIARRIFQAITDVDDRGRHGRKPRRLGPIEGAGEEERQDLEYVTGVAQAHLIPVIEAFRATHRSFLKPEPRQELDSNTVVGEDLHAGSVIDVWHESLIRNWSTLKGWIDAEARDADVYTELAREATLDAPTLYGGAKLQTGLEWTDRLLADTTIETGGPRWVRSRRRLRGLNAVETKSLRPWASKYEKAASRHAKTGPTPEIFGKALSFLNESRSAWIRTWRRRAYVVMFVLAALVVALVRQAAHTGAAVRSNRAQVAGALADPLERALVLAGVADQTPGSWGEAWFAGPFLRFGTDRTALTPRGIDTLAAASLLSGFPSAALTDPGLFGLDEVSAVEFAPGDSVVVFAATRATESGPEGLLVRWPASGAGEADVLWRSPSAQPTDIRVRPDGSVIALMDDGFVRTWAAGSADPSELALPSEGDPDVAMFLDEDPTGNAARFDREGSSLAVVYETEFVVVWRFSAGPSGAVPGAAEISTYEHLDAMDVSVGPGGALVASADAYGGVKIFDTGTGTTRWELEPQDSVEFMPSVTFAADGERVAWSSRGRGAFVLNLASAEFSGNTQPIELRGHGKAVTNLRFDLSGARLLTVSADSTAIVWDAESGTAIRTLRGHSAGLNSGRFGPDALVLTTADDGTARIWDGDTGAGIRILHGGGDHVLAEFAHASAYAVTLAARGGPRVWPLDDLPALVIWEEDGGLPAASLNGDTMFVVRGFESTVAWNLRTRSQVTDAAVIAGIAAEVATDTLPVPDAIAGGGSVQGRDESAEGRTVLVGYRTAAVHYAGAGTEPFATPERDVEVSAVALAPNPELFAVAFGKDEDDETATIELWTRGAVRPMNLRASGSVKAVAFSPDGTRLATAGETVQLWDPRTRVLLEAFGDMSEDLVTTVAFSADSRYLIAGTEEGELRVWRVDVRSLVSTPSGSPVQVWPASDWRRTVAAIEQRTTACLTAPQRARFLGETDRVAAGGAARCRDESARAE